MPERCGIFTRLTLLGDTILLVEQNARLALATYSRGYVMESGKITLADPRVRAGYLGE